MRAKLLQVLESVRSSFWFIPSVMVAVTAVLAIGAGRLDDRFGADDVPFWIYTGSASGAREVLSTIAGSMITVAGVVFSITIVALSLASQQFGPRLLRNFMHDSGTQVVLGTFTSVFVYSILILRTIRGDGDGFDRNVPYIAVTVGVGLSIVAVAVLIYFIHHVSLSIQADAIVARVAGELDASIEESLAGEDEVAPEPPAEGAEAWAVVGATGNGYIQAIDPDEIVQAARRRNAVVRMELAPGEFVYPGRALARVAPAAAAEDGAWIRGSLGIGQIRTPAHDPEFSVGRLVEMALRALSPALNDPFTAITCIDRLGAAFALAASRPLRTGRYPDEDGRVRLTVPLTNLERLAAASFHEIRQAAQSYPAVLMHMLSTFDAVIRSTGSDEAKRILRRHAELVCRAAGRDGIDEADRAAVEERYAAIVADGNGSGETPAPGNDAIISRRS